MSSTGFRRELQIGDFVEPRHKQFGHIHGRVVGFVDEDTLVWTDNGVWRTPKESLVVTVPIEIHLFAVSKTMEDYHDE